MVLIKKVTKNETIKPKVIIHPKSIIGLIPLKIRDKNAHIVVSTVYKIGSTIFLQAINTISFLLKFENSFLIVKIEPLNEYSLPYLK